MRSRGFNVAAVIEEYEGEELIGDRQDSTQKQYRRHRSLRTTRRAPSRMGNSQPALGMAGRRNRRWAW
jgi:hypothetical protein